MTGNILATGWHDRDRFMKMRFKYGRGTDEVRVRLGRSAREVRKTVLGLVVLLIGPLLWPDRFGD